MCIETRLLGIGVISEPLVGIHQERHSID